MFQADFIEIKGNNKLGAYFQKNGAYQFRKTLYT